MASILDAGLASVFSGLVVFLLVYALLWGLLTKLKLFGDNPGSYALIAFATAFLVAIAPPARNFVMFVAPWYLALAVVLFFIIFIVGMFGLKADKEIPEIIKQPRAYVWIIIFCVIIFIFGLAYSFGQQALESGTGVPSPAYQTGGVQGQLPGTIGPGGEPIPVQTGGQGGVGPVTNPGTPYQSPGIIAPQSYNLNTPGPQPGEPGATATNDFGRNFVNTLIHPKVLGLICVFFIASLAVYFLSSNG
jgi:hypothetical protein